MKKIINGQVLYDSEQRVLSVQGERIILSAPTSRLLELFIDNNYKQVNRELIIEEVWGKHGMIPSGHSLNKSVSILRKAFSSLGLNNIIVTIPREGFLFQARVSSVNDDIKSKRITTTQLDIVDKALQYRRWPQLILWCVFTFIVCAVMVFFLILMFRNNDGVVHILKSGSCDFYTTDDNSSVKLSRFLDSPNWQKHSSICEGRDKVIIFYDDNNLSAGNKLKEYFFSVCKMEQKGTVHECENYLY